MRFLVVAATERELASLAARWPPGGRRFDPLVTGVGMVATATHVSRAMARHQYDLAVNIGICGAFDRALPLGAVVHVVTDELPELGAEDGPDFLPAAAIGLMDADGAPFSGGRLVNTAPPASATLASLPAVTGITVNTVHGHDASIAAVRDRCAPQVESMEGAAFMYACLVAGVPCAQIRAVSNYVERRNRAAWRIPEALDALGGTAARILHEL